MEKNINPFSKVEQSSDYEQRERERSIELKIAQAFLKQKYPLSEKGKDLRQEIERIVKTLEQNPQNEKIWDKLHEVRPSLPTVENPQLELFEDLMVSPEDEEIFFGSELSTIQITKGCRHRCLHCAADAYGKVQLMPFAAILKIAEKIRENEERARAVQKEYLSFLTEQANDMAGLNRIFDLWVEIWNDRDLTKNLELKDPDMPSFFAMSGDFRGRHDYEWHEKRGLSEKEATKITEKDLFNSLHRRILNFHNLPFIYDYLLKAKEVKSIHDPRLDKLLNECRMIVEKLKSSFDYAQAKTVLGSVFSYIKSKNSSWEKQRMFPEDLDVMVRYHYYDSDPFDWRDANFLHDDGAMADYGDVIVSSATEGGRYFVSTAGWPITDKVAQRAALKIASFFSNGLSGLRVSVHPYETGTSHQDPEKYRRDMENVIQTFKNNKVRYVIFFEEIKKEHEQFAEQALIPLYDLIKSMRKNNGQISLYENARLSRFSGKIKNDLKNEDEDIMACMKGYHVLPDGSVALQISYEKNSRPVPTGKKIFEISGS